MKRGGLTLALGILFLAAGLVVGGLVGCANRHYQVSYVEFVKKANPPLSTLHAAEYIGSTEHRAFLWVQQKGVLGWHEHVYSVSLHELPADVRAAVEAGEDPFAPWRKSPPTVDPRALEKLLESPLDGAIEEDRGSNR